MRCSRASSARRSARARPDRGRKPSNTKRTVDKPAHDERADGGDRAWDRRDRVPRVEHGAHQALTRIADARGPGVGRHGDIPAVVEHREDLGHAGGLGVLVADRQADPADAGVLQQPARPAGVLAADQRRRGEGVASSHRQVAEVADRRGDQDEPARRALSHRTSAPARRAPRRRRRPPGPTARTRRFGLHHPRRLGHRQADAVAAHPHDLDDDAAVVDERHVEREAHPDRVDPPARPQHERTLEMIPRQQTPASGAAVGRDLCGGQHTRFAHQPAHGRSMARRPRSGTPAARRRYSAADATSRRSGVVGSILGSRGSTPAIQSPVVDAVSHSDGRQAARN